MRIQVQFCSSSLASEALGGMKLRECRQSSKIQGFAYILRFIGGLAPLSPLVVALGALWGASRELKLRYCSQALNNSMVFIKDKCFIWDPRGISCDAS